MDSFERKFGKRSINSFDGYRDDFRMDIDKRNQKVRQSFSNDFERDSNDADYFNRNYMNKDSFPNFTSPTNRRFLNSANQQSKDEQTSHKHGSQKRHSKRKRKRKTSRHLAVRFAEHTSLQGISFINRAGRWYSKTFWILIFLVALGVMSYQTYLVFKKYYSYTTTTSVSIGYDKLPFPSVTICNINPIRLSKVEEYGEDLEEFVEYMDPRNGYIFDENGTLIDEDSHEDNDLPVTTEASQPMVTTKLGGPPGNNVTEHKDLDCDGDDHRCTTPDSPCADDDQTCQNQYPSLYQSDDQFYSKKLNFMTRYETYEDEYDQDNDDDEGYYEDVRDYGGGDLSWTMRLREEYRDVMAGYTRSERADLGHQADSMILTCAFNGRTCQYWNFTHHISSDYGNCYTFNSAFQRRNPLKSRQSGSQYGLTLLLYTESHEYIAGLTQGHGMRFVVHPFNTMPFVVDNGVSLKPGEETFVGLRMINMTRLGGKYGDCGDDGAFHKSFGYTYTLEACVNTCLGRSIHRICNCYPEDFPELYNPSWTTTSKPCRTNQQWQCLYNERFKHELGKLNCKCEQACQTLEYDIEISRNAWPDASFWFGLVDAICERNSAGCEFMRKQDGSDEMRRKALQENFLFLHIYYRDLNFQLIQEKPEYEAEQFLSDFGGTIGLWVGASFITGVEVLDLLVQLIVQCYKRNS